MIYFYPNYIELTPTAIWVDNGGRLSRSRMGTAEKGGDDPCYVGRNIDMHDWPKGRFHSAVKPFGIADLTV